MNSTLTMNSFDYTMIGIIAGLAIIGGAANAFGMFILYKGGKIGNPFQQLCFSHCCANFLALLFFLFYCTPMAITRSSATTTGIAKLIGGFMVMLWDVSVYSHLMSAINRLIVISWPVDSRAFLTQRNSFIMIGIVWGLGFCHFIPYFNVTDCYIVFYPTIYLWAFVENNCGYLLGKILDFWTGVTVFAIIFLIDLWTLYKIQTIRETIGTGKRFQQDIKFFIQACLQFALFVVKLTNFYFISALFTSDLKKYNLQVFFTTTFAWECCHALDGIVLIPFHIGDYLRRQDVNYKTTISGVSMIQKTNMYQGASSGSKA